MTPREIASRVLDLQELTASTGLITKRSQGSLLKNLSDAQLSEVATEMARMKVTLAVLSGNTSELKNERVSENANHNHTAQVR